MKERRPRIPEDLAKRIDEARGMVPFEPWVRSALEAALGGPVEVDAPASPRASTKAELDGLHNIAESMHDCAARRIAENRGAAPPQVSAHVRPAIPKKG